MYVCYYKTISYKRVNILHIPMTSTTTIQELPRLFEAYGLPEQLVRDNGPQFISEEFSLFLKANRVKHLRSAPYHPSSNGLAERFVGTFKRALRAAESSGLTFHQQLMNFLLTYQTTPHSTTGSTPATQSSCSYMFGSASSISIPTCRVCTS